MPIKNASFLCLLLLCLFTSGQAQPYVKLSTFTTNEGLPSNHIYDIVEDNKGFLWLATDNGVSRFDGKYFQNFSVKNGLPGNDVLQVLKDGNGVIWVNSYKQVPAYFDEITNRFITITANKNLNEISKTLFLTSSMSNGAVKFYNTVGYVIFKDKKIIICELTGSYKKNLLIHGKAKPIPIPRVVNEEMANCMYTDRFYNLWLGTLDKGLIYFSRNGLNSIKIPAGLINPNFLSITINDYGELFAGNYYGQVLKVKGNLFEKHDNSNAGTAWIRKIFSTSKGIFTVKDNGLGVNFGPLVPVMNQFKSPASLKAATALNDSIIVLGSICGLISLNINSLTTKPLQSENDRTLSLVRMNHNVVYYIGSKGLYKYFYNKDSSGYIPLSGVMKDEKLSVLTFAPDSTLWASTVSGNLLVFKQDKIIATIRNDGSLPENITAMLGLKNKVWIGSKTGITILAYKTIKTGLQYTIRNLSKTDGLPSNTINDFAFKNDTVYAATENGIGIIPANYGNPRFEIAPELIAIKINQVDAPIGKKYVLESNHNNIALQFAGIDLSGHFKNIQYRVNTTSNWNNLTGNTLNIELASGSNKIYIRALDVNNQVSRKTLLLDFYIKTPFFKTIWFWTLVAACLTAFAFWWLNQRKLALQRNAFERHLDLELQRKKMIADLHDDIGATLSSLQLNSAVANQLIHKDVKRTRIILDKIENQSKNLADKIGDIIWSMKPGKDEFMTLSSRIKNFANDILSATDINYKVKIDPVIDDLVKDITARKNIVLIAKEAINNAAKYSNAAEVSVNMDIFNNQICITVKDNGTGFDPHLQKGNGLDNMRKRTEELSGHFEICSEKKSGTSVLVRIPLIP